MDSSRELPLFERQVSLESLLYDQSGHDLAQVVDRAVAALAEGALLVGEESCAESHQNLQICKYVHSTVASSLRLSRKYIPVHGVHGSIFASTLVKYINGSIFVSAFMILRA